MYPKSSSTFPERGVLPKQETGALDFIRDYPQYDGRGTIVAILDTGCDPGANGLQTTSEGLPKFIDVVDATGSGDIDCSTYSNKPSNDNTYGIYTIKGLSGRTLQLNDAWVNENIHVQKKFKLGSIRAYDFFPSSLKNRLESKRSKKYEKRFNKSLADLRSKIAMQTKDLNTNKKLSIAEKKCLKLEIEDNQLLLEHLSKEKESTSGGPIFDCVLWNTGQQWMGILDTSTIVPYVNCTDIDCKMKEIKVDDEEEEQNAIIQDKVDGNKVIVDGNKVIIDENGCKCVIYDISHAKVLTNYRVCGEYGTVSCEDLLNYVMNIYDDGNVLSLVVPAGTHGTHVAGIVGAFYESKCSDNGIAPGCQLISVKIGDTRLSTMETNQGLMRALQVVRENNCDLINMSYGEPSTMMGSGSFPDGVEELVWKHGVIFIGSAGNAGPCLSTSGAPQAMTDAIIGIGAMFSPQMVKSEYGYADSPDMQAYSWTSRGPTTDGAIGVEVCAPGGAISPVPSYTLNKNQLMNGTSMASPNACGNCALLLSALKQEQIAYSPWGIELALINSAKCIPTIKPCAAGYGLLQIRCAYQYCKNNVQLIGEQVHYKVSVNGRNHSNYRGIYIREPLIKPCTYNVSIRPQWRDDVPNEKRVEYQLKCHLRSTANWVQPTEYSLMSNGGRGFEIKVDPSHLCFNNNNYTPFFQSEVVGIDTNNTTAGPIFRIPITVCNPIQYPLEDNLCCDNNPYCYQRIDSFTESVVSRVFHQVPNGAHMAKISVRCISTQNSKKLRFYVSSLYRRGMEQVEYSRGLYMQTGTEQSYLFSVEPNVILETNLCQYALNVGRSTVEWSVEFLAPLISSSLISINSTSGFSTVCVRTEDIPMKRNTKLCAKFNTFSRTHAPKFATISNGLIERGDISLKEEQIYILLLEYEFTQVLAGKSHIKFPLLDDLLYESVYDGMFWMIFDTNKQLIKSGEAYEESVSLSKQDYVCHLQIRHSSVKLLENLKTLALKIETCFSTAINADIYKTKRDMQLKCSKVSKLSLKKFCNLRLYIASPNVTAKNLAVKKVCVGDELLGYMKVGCEDEEFQPRFRNTGCSAPASLCVPIVCTLGCLSSTAAKSRNKLTDIEDDGEQKDESKDENKDGNDSSAEDDNSLQCKKRDLVIDWISKKLKGKEQLEAFESFGKQLIEEYPKHIPLLMLQLSVYQNVEKKCEEYEQYQKQMLNICDSVIQMLDVVQIRAHFGTKVVDKNCAKYKKMDKKCKEEKQFIVDCFLAKLNIIRRSLMVSKKVCESCVIFSDTQRVAKEDLVDFEENLDLLKSWIEVKKEKKCWELLLFWYLQKGRIGNVLAMINERIDKDESAGKKADFEMKLDFYRKYLGKEWLFLVEKSQLDIFKAFPEQYRLF